MNFVPDVKFPDLGDLQPSLIPKEARPYVLAPIYLVKGFVRILSLVVIVLLVLVCVAIGIIPLQLAALGIFAAITIMSLMFAFGYVSVNKIKQVTEDLIEQLELLEGLAAGEISAAIKVAQILASSSVKTAGNAAGALMNTDATELLGNASDAAGTAVGATADATAAAVGATADATAAAGRAAADAVGQGYGAVQSAFGMGLSAIVDPVGAAGAVADASTSAARGAVDVTTSAATGAVNVATSVASGAVSLVGDAVSAAMELNPLYAFQNIIEKVLKLCIIFIAIASPSLCFAGWALWKLRIQVSGLQLFGMGLLLGLGGFLSWYLVRRRADNQLFDAANIIIDIHKENLEKMMNALD